MGTMGRLGFLCTTGMGAIVVVGYAQGCGGDESNPPAGGDVVDAALSDDASVDVDRTDATTDAGGEDASSEPACDLEQPFGTPTVLDELTIGTSRHGARFSADMREVVFHANTGDGNRLYYATREDVTEPFSTPTSIPGLDGDGGTAVAAAYPAFSADGLTIYFESSVSGPVQLWYATRASKGDPFGEPELVQNVTSTANTGQPYLVEESSQLWFVSREDGGKGQTDIFWTSLSDAGVSDGFKHVPELNDEELVYLPAPSADVRTILFARRMLEDGGASSKVKIWSATRATQDEPFSNIKAETTLWSEDGDDFATWLSPDGCTAAIASDRDGTMKIYVASRPK